MMDTIIFACLAALVLLGGASFLIDPRYEKGVWVVLAAVSHLLSAAAGAKFGLALPQVGVGVQVVEEAPKEEKAVGFAPPVGHKP